MLGIDIYAAELKVHALVNDLPVRCGLPSSN